MEIMPPRFQNRDYYKLGVYTVMSIVQGGCSLPYLSKPFFNYLLYGTYTGISTMVVPSDIPDFQLTCIVEKVQCYTGTVIDLKICRAGKMSGGGFYIKAY